MDPCVNQRGAVMRHLDLVIKNGTLVLGGGSYRMAVGIQDGNFAALGREEFLPPATEEIDAAGLHVLPGIVDSEAHPGCYVPFRYDMTAESRAACAGITSWGIQAPSTRLGTEPLRKWSRQAMSCPSTNASAPGSKLSNRFR